ncbi:hypothetical protein Droror1_Dr00017287 [Drosera rotundifolia]
MGSVRAVMRPVVDVTCFIMGHDTAFTDRDYCNAKKHCSEVVSLVGEDRWLDVGGGGCGGGAATGERRVKEKGRESEERRGKPRLMASDVRWQQAAVDGIERQRAAVGGDSGGWQSYGE